ncbi:hypothetical protein ES708_04654 [subsurface metagenome]
MVADIIRASSVVVAMAIIGLLMWRALSMGIDGALFMSSVAVVGGLAGYEVKALVDKKKSKGPTEG